jgi:hypothetical protein
MIGHLHSTHASEYTHMDTRWRLAVRVISHIRTKGLSVMDILSRSLFKGHLSLKPKRIFSNTVRESLNTNTFYHEISPRKTFSEIYLIERIVSLFL